MLINTVTIDGIEGKKYDAIFMENLFSGSDSDCVTYLARENKNLLLIKDGQENKYTDFGIDIDRVYCTADYTRIAICDVKKNSLVVISNGKEEKRYDQIHSIYEPMLSHNLNHIYYYIVGKRGKRYLVVDGEKRRLYYNIIKKILIKAGGEQIIYIARHNGKEFVVINGKEEKPYDEITYDSLTFSPDGNHIVYRAEEGIAGEGGKAVIVVNGKEKNRYDGVGIPVFSSDSKHIAYGAGVGLNFNSQGDSYVLAVLKHNPNIRQVSKEISTETSKKISINWGTWFGNRFWLILGAIMGILFLLKRLFKK